MISTTPYLDWLIALGGALAVLLGWFKWGRKKVQTVRATSARRVRMMEEIYVTLKPNGGTSLVDHVAEIKQTTRLIDRTLSTTEIGRRTLVSVMEIGEWHSDAHGQCTFINAAACRLTNRPESDFLGRNWYNVVHKDDVERVAHEWYLAVEERRTFRMRYRWVRSDGSPVPISVVANPVVDSGGDLIGWVAIVRQDGEQA